MRLCIPILCLLVLAGCRPGSDSRSGQLPRTGLALADSGRSWCAEFVADSTAPPMNRGRRLTVVFPGPAAVPALRARLGDPRPGQCPAEFPQPRWIDYTAYGLELVDSLPDSAPIVALVVASEARWTRGPDSIVRADLDDDGHPEEARRCTADEGEHFTLWSTRPGSGQVRRWHEYYDWGGLTEPACRPGEASWEP